MGYKLGKRGLRIKIVTNRQGYHVSDVLSRLSANSFFINFHIVVCVPYVL